MHRVDDQRLGRAHLIGHSPTDVPADSGEVGWAFRMMSATRFRSKPAIDSDRCRPVGERPVVGCGWHLCIGDGRFADDVVPAADWYLAIAQRRTSLASAGYGRRRALTALLRNGPGIPPSYRAAPVRHP